MVESSATDGLSAVMHPESKGFYNCNCGWSGKRLAYANGLGNGRFLLRDNRQYGNHRAYKPLQGHCPECGIPFEGCFSFLSFLNSKAIANRFAHAVGLPIIQIMDDGTFWVRYPAFAKTLIARDCARLHYAVGDAEGKSDEQMLYEARDFVSVPGVPFFHEDGTWHKKDDTAGGLQ